MICYWDSWNRDHATRHGVSERESTYIVQHARPPYPEYIGGGKYIVRGSTAAGGIIQAIFVLRSGSEVKVEELSLEELTELESNVGPYAYIIHARELEPKEKRRHRRRRR